MEKEYVLTIPSDAADDSQDLKIRIVFELEK